MPDRVNPGNARMGNALNFLLNMKINFSISGDVELGHKFRVKASDNNTDASKLLRKYLFNELKIKKEDDLLQDDEIDKCIKKIKERIYTKLNCNRKKSFSNLMMDSVKKYLDIKEESDEKK